MNKSRVIVIILILAAILAAGIFLMRRSEEPSFDHEIQSVSELPVPTVAVDEGDKEELPHEEEKAETVSEAAAEEIPGAPLPQPVLTVTSEVLDEETLAPPLFSSVHLTPDAEQEDLVVTEPLQSEVHVKKRVYVNGLYVGVVDAVEKADGSVSYDEEGIVSLVGGRHSLAYLCSLAVDTDFGDEIRFEFLPEDIPSIRIGEEQRSEGFALDFSNALLFNYDNTLARGELFLDSSLHLSGYGFSASASLLFDYYISRYFKTYLPSYSLSYTFGDHKLSIGNTGHQLLVPSSSERRVEGVAYDFNEQRGTSIYIEKASRVTIMSPLKEKIFEGVLNAGSYDIEKLFNQKGSLSPDSGISRYTVRIAPLDGSPAFTRTVKHSYSDDLLPAGALSFGLFAGIERSKDFQYYLKRYGADAYALYGLTDDLAVGGALSFANRSDTGFSPEIRGSLAVTASTSAGTFRLGGYVDFAGDGNGTFSKTPYYSATVAWQYDPALPLMEKVSLDLSYRSPKAVNEEADRHFIALGGSVEGSFGLIDWDLGATAAIHPSLRFNSISSWALHSEGAISVAFNEIVSFSTSASLGYNSTEHFYYEGRAGVTITFSPSRAELYSTYEGGVGLKGRIAEGAHALSADISSAQVWKVATYNIRLSYAYRSPYFAGDLFVTGKHEAGVHVSTRFSFQEGVFSFRR